MKNFQEIIKELLKSNNLNAPFLIDKKIGNYRDDLENKLKIYLKKIKNLKSDGEITDWLKENVDQIIKINKGLLSSIDEYLKGNAGKSYNHLVDMLNVDFVKENIEKLIVPLGYYHQKEYHAPSLYRVRYSDKNLTSVDEMFHIPFNLRHIINNQRYSIAGVPCLYLGESLLVCWKEMGCPDLNKLYLSRFQTKDASEQNDVNVLDLAFSFENLTSTLFEELTSGDDEDEVDKLKAYLIIWPILLSCSYNKQNQDSNFNIEYIIPNLLLQWSRNTELNIAGIKYLSTKSSHIRNSDLGVNYVFPTSFNSVKHHGFCDELSSIFVLSNPVSWQLLTTVNIEMDKKDEQFRRTDNIDRAIVEKYKSTLFYTMEQKIKAVTQVESINNISSEVNED